MSSHSRKEIINEARKQDADIGDGAMIADGEHGYWVAASIYVETKKIDSVIKQKKGKAV